MVDLFTPGNVYTLYLLPFHLYNIRISTLLYFLIRAITLAWFGEKS